MIKANGLGEHIDQAIEKMEEAHRAGENDKKKIFAIGKATINAVKITKAAERTLWSAVYRIISPDDEEKYRDYRNDEEYR